MLHCSWNIIYYYHCIHLTYHITKLFSRCVWLWWCECEWNVNVNEWKCSMYHNVLEGERDVIWCNGVRVKSISLIGVMIRYNMLYGSKLTQNQTNKWKIIKIITNTEKNAKTTNSGEKSYKKQNQLNTWIERKLFCLCARILFFFESGLLACY